MNPAAPIMAVVLFAVVAAFSLGMFLAENAASVFTSNIGTAESSQARAGTSDNSITEDDVAGAATSGQLLSLESDQADVGGNPKPLPQVGGNNLLLNPGGGKVGIGTFNPTEQLEITGNFRLPPTTATTGIIMSGADPFIHNFGTNNFFAGVDAGNLTMTGDRNIGIGAAALFNNTTGGSACQDVRS